MESGLCPVRGLAFVAGSDFREQYSKHFPTLASGEVVPAPVLAIKEIPGDQARNRKPDIAAIVLTGDGRLWQVYQSAGRFIQYDHSAPRG